MVKRIKAPPSDLQTMLLRVEPRALARMLRAAPRDETLEVLLEVLGDTDEWRDLRIPARIAEVLLELGEEEALLDELFALAPDWHDGDDAELLGLGGMVVTIGTVGSLRPRERVLDVLDETLAGTGHLHPATDTLTEILVHFGERGTRCERAWQWLERVRVNNQELWAGFAGSYGDARAVPILHGLLDPIDPASLDGLRGDDPVARIVIEGVDALEQLAAVRPRDTALLELLRAIFRAPAG